MVSVVDVALAAAPEGGAVPLAERDVEDAAWGDDDDTVSSCGDVGENPAGSCTAAPFLSERVYGGALLGMKSGDCVSTPPNGLTPTLAKWLPSREMRSCGSCSRAGDDSVPDDSLGSGRLPFFACCRPVLVFVSLSTWEASWTLLTSAKGAAVALAPSAGLR